MMGEETNMILVVGSTGFLGGEVCRLLRTAGKPVRALARPTADAAKRAALEKHGAEVHHGDLKQRESLVAACRGATTVISTASATLSRQEGDSIETVDRDGQIALVEAAKAAGVRHFVYVSFAPLPTDFALQRAKRAVEARVRESGMAYTILQPTDFMEVWLSPALGFDAAHGKARVLGAGDKPVSWISLGDVARFAAAAVDAPAARGGTFPLGGPEGVSYLDAIRIFEELGAPKVAVEHVPESALEAQLAGANGALEEAFGALMLCTARGALVDSSAALAAMPIGPLTSVRDYAKHALSSA
jgi:NADH dehydrogenase